VPFNGGNEGGDAAVIFPPVEVVGADHGGGARPASGGGLRALLRCRRRKETTGWAMWAERLNGPAGRWADWVES
jgi:hypothetical protein